MITYQNHLEVSEGDTVLVSSVLCPLPIPDIKKEQLFEDSNGKPTVMCCIKGQKDSEFVCPHFYGAVFPAKKNIVDCRHSDNKYKIKTDEE